MEIPNISVIIPVHNGAAYLAEAVQSVLAQTLPPTEILLVNNASTDATAEIAQSFGAPVRYFYLPQPSAAAARNHGVAQAQGDWLAFLDADDVWLPAKLAQQWAALAAEATLEAVYGHAEQFVSPELDEQQKAALACPTEPMAAWLPSAVLIRRTAFLRAGFYDTTPQIGEVVEWLIRAREADVKSLMLPEIVFRRRLHRTNQGVTKRDQRQDYVRVLKAALDRRRQRASGGNAAQ